MKLLEPRIKRWTRDEFHQMAELGWFRGGRAFLLSGEIYEMAGQGNWHSVGIGLADELLRTIFKPGEFWIRIQMPLDLPDGGSDPEPDLAIVPGSPRDFVRHPSTAALAIEVADTSLAVDRKKAAYYAAAGIPEYWIVNLRDRVLELHRAPRAQAGAEWTADEPPQAGYDDRQVLTLDATLAPVAAPHATIAVADLFPARPPGDTF